MKLKSNIGTADRTFRLILSIILIIFFYTGFLPGLSGVIALIVALLLTVSSLLSYCPIYRLLKLNSIFDKNKANYSHSPSAKDDCV